MEQPLSAQTSNPQPKNQQQLLEFLNKKVTYLTGYSVSRNSEVKADTLAERRVMSFPRLWGLDQSQRFRYWDIYAAIAVNNAPVTAQELKLLPIAEEYVNRAELPKNACGVYWTETGVEDTPNPIISAPTLLTEGKGYRGSTRASNYTTPFTQALLDVKSFFEEQIKNGYAEHKSQLLGTGEITLEKLLARPNNGPYPPWRVFAMALHDYKKQSKHIEFPCWIDPKYDGIMGIAVQHPGLPMRPVVVIIDGKTKKVGIRMDMYSRGKKTIDSQDHILLELHKHLKKRPGLHVVFEIWKQGRSLQEISGFVRRGEDSSRGTAEKMEAHVFDCFRIDDPELTYEERRSLLEELFEEMDAEHEGNTERYVVRVPSERCYDDADVQRHFKRYLGQNLEGAIVRNDAALYEFGLDNEIRSYDVLKLKPRPDGEYPVVGFTDGKGKETGQVKWIMAENEAGVLTRVGRVLPLEERIQFRATPNQSEKLRRHIYKKISEGNFFKKHILGQEVVVSYMSLSKDKNIPTQPKVLRFRRKEIDLLLQEGFSL